MLNDLQTPTPHPPLLPLVPERNAARSLLPELSVECVDDPARFAGLRAEWNALVARSRAGSFNQWEWLYPWYRRIGRDRALRLLTARGPDGELVGLLPLGLERLRIFGRTVRRLAFLGETHVGSDDLDLVAPAGREDELAAAFATYLRDTAAGWDVIDLLDLTEGAPTLEAFRRVFGAGFLVQVMPRHVCPFERLVPGEAFDAFLARTARRDNFLRRKKWLEKQPGYRVELSTAPGELARPASEFFRLHRARWDADGGSQGIKGPSVEAFHRDAMALLAEQGRLRLYTMWVGDQAVASVYGIVDRGTFSYFQSGYDPAWRSKSVGLVLVGETFRDALGAGCHTYDFLRGVESYKGDWVTSRRQTVALRIHPERGVGAWLGRRERAGKRARDAVKNLLPGGLEEKIRRLRRRRAQI